LAEPGVSVEEGERLLSVGGVPVDEHKTPGELLVHQADQIVSLSVGQGTSIKKQVKGSKGQVSSVKNFEEDARQVLVKTLSGEQEVRYREWVRENIKTVDSLTGGRVGYLHIPDMSTLGIAEFHRGYLAQVDREGLIVDARYNAGGMVSPLILEKLAHRHLGFDVPRWGTPESYPYHTLRGHLIVIANQFTGSDGDMFTTSFRQLQLGQLVGKRTWVVSLALMGVTNWWTALQPHSLSIPSGFITRAGQLKIMVLIRIFRWKTLHNLISIMKIRSWNVLLRKCCAC